MHLYSINNETLETMDIINILPNSLVIDEETNEKSTITIVKDNARIKQGYFVVIEDKGKIIYQGIVCSPISYKNETCFEIIVEDISNIFNRKILLKDEDVMIASGVETFISKMINDFFSNSQDSLLNLNYIETIVKTNTKRKAAINEDNGIYNFHTFITNCRQNYNIFTDFEIQDKKLKVTIEYREMSILSIDTTVSEIKNYQEIDNSSIIAKVSCLCGDTGNVKDWFLREDHTITDDAHDINRIKGYFEFIYVDKEENSYSQVLNVFKGNRYQHLIEFDINQNTRLFDISKLKIGAPILIKTKNGVLESYISSITQNQDNTFLTVRTGNVRLDLLYILKKQFQSNVGNKVDKSGGTITGNLNINGKLICNGKNPLLFSTMEEIDI